MGVIILMWGANVPLIYYSFVCDPELQLAYWFITTSLALLCSVVTFKPRFSDPHLRPLRAATFGCLALSTFIPVFHGLLKYSYETHSQRIGLRWILLTLLFNSLGAAAYATKVSSSLLKLPLPQNQLNGRANTILSSRKSGILVNSTWWVLLTASCTALSSRLRSCSILRFCRSLTSCTLVPPSVCDRMVSSSDKYPSGRWTLTF
jgi:hypothetical protein